MTEYQWRLCGQGDPPKKPREERECVCDAIVRMEKRVRGDGQVARMYQASAKDTGIAKNQQQTTGSEKTELVCVRSWLLFCLFRLLVVGNQQAGCKYLSAVWRGEITCGLNNSLDFGVCFAPLRLRAG
eukprot:TRINITY_DN4094_c0_g1_i1.p1 TRINITY_DN4094_c0_g1~~TRINITY_DN4094_c0_g1_i1.p1  ORF type:complete len:128 (-),score=7.68 TRINITY_DN4094_c0_g1_i1:300-683(-)